MKRITGHLEEKNGKYYAAVNHYTVDGKRKVKWHSVVFVRSAVNRMPFPWQKKEKQ